jgi:hypothetical protein
MGLLCFSLLTAITSLNSTDQLIFVMVKCYVLFEVGTGFLTNFRPSVFLCLQANAEMVPKFQVSTACFHAPLPILNSSKLPPVVDSADLIVF